MLLQSFQGSHSSVDADSNFLEYDAMLIDKQLLPFRRRYLHPSSWYKKLTTSSLIDQTLKLAKQSSSSNFGNTNQYGIESQKSVNLSSTGCLLPTHPHWSSRSFAILGRISLLTQYSGPLRALTGSLSFSRYHSRDVVKRPTQWLDISLQLSTDHHDRRRTPVRVAALPLTGEAVWYPSLQDKPPPSFRQWPRGRHIACLKPSSSAMWISNGPNLFRQLCSVYAPPTRSTCSRPQQNSSVASPCGFTASFWHQPPLSSRHSPAYSSSAATWTSCDQPRQQAIHPITPARD